MSSVYIITVIKNDNSDVIDAFLELSTNKNNHPFIEVRTKEKSSHDDNQILLYKYISKNFAQVSFSDTDDKQSCSLKYLDKNSVEYNVSFYFDSQSTSAFAHFRQKFSEMINTNIETINYPSGNIYYFGETCDSPKRGIIPDGSGTTHYDNGMLKVKYVGEFENGKYDGEGEFFSCDNKFSIKANNISNGIPTETGLLSIKLGTIFDEIEIDFNYLYEYFELDDKKEKQKFIKSDTFVKKVAELYWTQEESIESFIFREHSVENKHLEVWNQLQELHNKVDRLLLLNEPNDSTDLSNKTKTKLKQVSKSSHSILRILDHKLFGLVSLFIILIFGMSCKYQIHLQN
jgi:hypothetical protein